MKQELITWKPAGRACVDEESTVLINTADGEVGAGFLEGGEWHWANGFTAKDVRYFAELPVGAVVPIQLTEKARELLRRAEGRGVGKKEKKGGRGAPVLRVESKRVLRPKARRAA